MAVGAKPGPVPQRTAESIRLATNHSPLVTAFLIATPAIRIRPKSFRIMPNLNPNRHKTPRSRSGLLPLATSHSPLATSFLIANPAIRNSSQVAENKRDSKILIANLHPSAATALKDRRKSVLIAPAAIRNHRKSLKTKGGHESNQHKKYASDQANRLRCPDEARDVRFSSVNRPLRRRRCHQMDRGLQPHRLARPCHA